jgi:metal-responsive CopG/Arc/MetJ family transcriptional regulator
MSQIISFSADDLFADGLETMIEKSGYQNRSRFLRDAAVLFAELKQRGELENMADDEVVEGHIIVYYQHNVERKLIDLRHSNLLDVSTYNHSCLKHSHSCVDIMQAIGPAKAYRHVIEELQNTPSVDKVTFVSAPMREHGCC